MEKEKVDKMIPVSESIHSEVMRIKYMLRSKSANEALRKIIQGYYAGSLNDSE